MKSVHDYYVARKFQFHKVRLKDDIIRLVVDFIMFQFHKVRLKAA